LLLKRFDKYVLSEISAPFYIGLIVYSFTMLVNTFFVLSELLISKGAPPLTVIRMLLFIMPTILSLTVPMATLMGVLAGLSRMSSDSEVLALRTLGVHHHRLYKPVLVFSLFTWIVSSMLSMYLGPEAQYQFNRLQTQVFLSKAINQVKPRAFYTELSSYVLFFEDIDPKTREWIHVFLCSYKVAESDLVILADRGKFTYTSESRRSGYMTLYGAKVHRFNRFKPDESYELTSYNTLIEDVSENHDLTMQRRPTDLPVHKVWSLMLQNRDDVRLAIEFHNRFAFPFAALVLGFLGVSLGVSTRRGGRTSGFVLSLALIFIYYALMTLGRNLALSKTIPPYVGIWGANFFLLLVGLMAFRVTSQGSAFRFDSFRHLWKWIRSIKDRLYGLSPKPLLLVRYYRLRFRLPLVKLLDAYILRRLVFIFSMVFLSLMAIMYISKILELIDNIFNNDLPFSLVFVYLYHNTPELISITLPIAVLTSVLLTFSLMSKQNEITTVQVSGISIHRILLPALVFGVIISLLFFALQEGMLPQSSQKAKDVLNTIYGRNQNAQAYQNMQKNWVMDSHRRIFFYSHFDESEQRFHRFNMVELENSFVIKTRLSAEWAAWKDGVTLTLHNGTARLFQDSTPFTSHTFQEHDVIIPEGERLFRDKRVNETPTEYMNISQLRGYVSYLEENQSDSTRYQAKIYQRIFYPFSSLVMVLIAIPFAFLMGRKGAMHGIGAAVVISMVFMGMIGFLNSLGNNGILAPILSGSIPYLLFTVVSLFLMIKIRT